MGTFASDIDAMMELKPSPDLMDNGAAASKDHARKLIHENDFPNNELNVLNDKIEMLEKKNEQLVSYVNFLFQLISQLQTKLGERQQVNETIVPRNAAEPIKVHNTRKEPNPILTPRELDVFDLLAEGLCAKEIACKLGISETTVISHKKNLKAKFNAKNSAELISSMLRNRKIG